MDKNINIIPKTLSINTMWYYKDFFIIPEKIKEILIKLFKDISKNSKHKKLFINNNDIYLIDGSNLYLLKYNQDFLFIPKYIFFYKTNTILESEKKILGINSIEDYIEKFNSFE